jgi:hypothetical protein
VRGESPPAPVSSRGLLLGFRCKFPTVVIDNDQMQPGSFEQTIEVNDPRDARTALDSRDELVRNASPLCHLTLALICVPPRRAQITIDREVRHVQHCAPLHAAHRVKRRPLCSNSISVDIAAGVSLSQMLCSAAPARADLLCRSSAGRPALPLQRGQGCTAAPAPAGLHCRSSAGRAALPLQRGQSKASSKEFWCSWREPPQALTSGRRRLVHTEAAAGEVQLSFGLADAFVDDE